MTEFTFGNLLAQLHVDGHTLWRAYVGRFENSMEHSAFTFDAFPAEYHEIYRTARGHRDKGLAPGDCNSPGELV